MLTVKHIAPSGVEHMFPALQGTYDPTEYQTAPVNRVIYTSDSDDNGVDHHWMDDGVVYVMNAAGATVARYRLGSEVA